MRLIKRSIENAMLAPEFQRKQQLQAQQYREAQQPAGGPKEHPEDILVVHNILVGSNHEVEEPIPYARAKEDIDPNTGAVHFVNRIEADVYMHSWNTKDYFEVRWDGRPHRVRAGERRRMPRYLANHFAKHLIDYILIHQEDEENERRKQRSLPAISGTLRSRAKREELYKQIIESVDSYYNEDLYDFQRPGEQLERQVQELNTKPEPNAIDLGTVPNPAIGYTSDADPQPVEVDEAPDPMPSGEPSGNPLLDKRSRNELFKEAKLLNLKVTGKETKEQLFQMITNF
jgi:hypothetical protein